MKKTLAICSVLAAVSSGAAMAAELTIDNSITLAGLQAPSHPWHAYLLTVSEREIFCLPPADEGNKLIIRNEKDDKLGTLLAAGMLVDADGDVCSNSIDMAGSVLSKTLYGGYLYNGNGNVEGNEVTISNSELTSVRAGQISGTSIGNVSGNHTTISGSTVSGTMYGAYHSGTSGDVTGNSTTIGNGSVLYTVYGASHSGTSGAVTGNSTTISDSSVSYAVYGARHSGASGEVSDNILILRNSSVQEYVYGARFTGEKGGVSNNRLTIENCNITKSSSNIYAGQLGLSGKGEGNITGNILTIKGSQVGNLSAGFHRGSSGNVEDNHVIMENSTQSNANWKNSVTGGYIYVAGSKGNIIGNTVTLINSSVLDVEAARHQGASGDVTGNIVTLTDSQAKTADAVFIGRVVSDKVSDNHLILQGESVVSGDTCVVSIADGVTSTTAKNLSGNSITLRDTANVGGDIYAYYEGDGVVERAEDNYLVIDKNWTGRGNETTTFAEDSLNAVIHFDSISIGWTEEGRTLHIKELSVNENSASPLTFRINDADSVVKVGTLNNPVDKDIVIEGSSRVRDQLGSGEKLRNGLRRMASAVQVDDDGSGSTDGNYDAHPAAEVVVEESELYGAVSAKIDNEGDIMENSYVEQRNLVNDALLDIASSRMLAFRTQSNELFRRLRELRSMPGGKYACWARATAGREKYSLPGSDYRRNGIEMGVDRSFADGRYVAGLAMGYSDARASFAGGRADEQLYTFGAYAGWQGKRGQYVDVIAKHSRFDSDFNLYRANGALVTGDADTWGNTLSLNYGWRLEGRKGGFYAEPFAGLMYGFIDGADYTTNRGVTVQEKYEDSFVGSLGLTVGYVFGENRASAYARAALHHDWTSEAEVKLRSGEFTRNIREDLSGSYGEFAVGGTYRLGGNTWLFGEFQTMGGAHVRQPWQINIGAAYSF